MHLIGDGGKMNPYKDIMLNETTILREFSTDHEDIEFVWHRDDCDRVLEVFSGAGWKLQLDNELPVDLVEGQYVASST